MVRTVLAHLLVYFATAGTPNDIYNQNVDTVKGCVCKSECTTSFLRKCYVQPFCTVVDKDCVKGQASWSHMMWDYYDFCKYEPYQTYEKLPAAQKKDMVMAHINEDAGTKGVYPGKLSIFTGIISESVMVSFDVSADVFPAMEKRTKYIHSVGVTGGIKFESVGNHSYGGLFRGAEHGLIRFSSAKSPDKDGVAPGMGVKFFRDGRPSANFVAMYSLDGQTCAERNFFANDWSNHISLTDNFGLKLLAKKFWQASYCPLTVGLSDLAINSAGEQEEFPWRLHFHALVDSDCPCDNYDKCLANFENGNVTVGDKLFEVRAEAYPDAEKELIGYVYLTDKLLTSKFGDEQLFFRHQHMENDFKLKPEWLSSIDRPSVCGMTCTTTEIPTIENGCKSPFNTSSSMLSSDIVI